MTYGWTAYELRLSKCVAHYQMSKYVPVISFQKVFLANIQL